jgi:hypothetical protein
LVIVGTEAEGRLGVTATWERRRRGPRWMGISSYSRGAGKEDGAAEGAQNSFV